MTFYIRYFLVFALLMPITSVSDELEEDERARIYRSQEERREAGLGRQVTDWLQVSGLFETSKEFLETNSSNGNKTKEYDRPVTTIELGFNLTFNDWLAADFLFTSEYDFDSESNNQLQSEMEEGFIEIELGEWGVKAGRLYVPFGEYYSHFATGPFLEFGETRGDGVVVDYSFDDRFEISGYVFDSKVDKQNNDGDLDWGASIEFVSLDESIRLGWGYLSDLAESDEEFLADENDRYERKVSAWNAYALLGFESYEVTAEYVHANHSFEEFDAGEDRPEAFNLELAFFTSSTTQLSFRYEHSKEYSDAPKYQYGVSATWAPINHFAITIDYLHGKYKKGFAEDDDGNDLDDQDLIVIEASLEF